MTDVLPYAAVVGATMVPFIAVRFISVRYFDLARDTWLLGLSWFATFLVSVSISLPLGLMCGIVLWHWRSWRELPAVATWAAIVATWVIAHAAAPTLRDALPIGWRLAALILMAGAFYQRWHGMEVKASTGSRILLSGLLVLIWPFSHPIEWPAYALAFWLTSSWVAWGALAVAICWRYPVATPYVGAIVGLVLVAYCIPWTRRVLIDRTPRGGSLDGLRMRLRTWWAMIVVTTAARKWLVGWGPNPANRVGDSLEHALSIQAVLLSDKAEEDVPLNTSPTHCEPLELACTYGVVAVVAMGLLVWHCAGAVILGDAWSAAAIAGGVLSLATIPARAAPVGVVWLVVLAVVCS